MSRSQAQQRRTFLPGRPTSIHAVCHLLTWSLSASEGLRVVEAVKADQMLSGLEHRRTRSEGRGAAAYCLDLGRGRSVECLPARRSTRRASEKINTWTTLSRSTRRWVKEQSPPVFMQLQGSLWGWSRKRRFSVSAPPLADVTKTLLAPRELTPRAKRRAPARARRRKNAQCRRHRPLRRRVARGPPKRTRRQTARAQPKVLALWRASQ